MLTFSKYTCKYELANHQLPSSSSSSLSELWSHGRSVQETETWSRSQTSACSVTLRPWPLLYRNSICTLSTVVLSSPLQMSPHVWQIPLKLMYCALPKNWLSLQLKIFIPSDNKSDCDPAADLWVQGHLKTSGLFTVVVLCSFNVVIVKRQSNNMSCPTGNILFQQWAYIVTLQLVWSNQFKGKTWTLSANELHVCSGT